MFPFLVEAYLLTNIAEKEEHSTQGDQSGEELLLQSRKQEEIDLSEFGFGGICLTSLSKEMLIQVEYICSIFDLTLGLVAWFFLNCVVIVKILLHVSQSTKVSFNPIQIKKLAFPI